MSKKSYRKKSPYKALNCKQNAFCAKKYKDLNQFISYIMTENSCRIYATMLQIRSNSSVR